MTDSFEGEIFRRIFEGSGGRITFTKYIKERYTLDIMALRRIYFMQMMKEAKEYEKIQSM